MVVTGLGQHLQLLERVPPHGAVAPELVRGGVLARSHQGTLLQQGDDVLHQLRLRAAAAAA